MAHHTSTRTLAGDCIDARGRVMAAHAETPEWLQRSHEAEWWPSAERPVPLRTSVVLPVPRHVALAAEVAPAAPVVAIPEPREPVRHLQLVA